MWCDSLALLSFQLSIDLYFYHQFSAPDEHMKVVHFNCKQTLKNQCGLNLCLRCKNGLSCVRSTCGGCFAIGCYNGTMDIEKNVSNDDIENYNNLFEKFISHITERGPGTLSHLRWSSLWQKIKATS